MRMPPMPVGRRSPHRTTPRLVWRRSSTTRRAPPTPAPTAPAGFARRQTVPARRFEVMTGLSRREFMLGAVAAGALVACSDSSKPSTSRASSAAATGLPDPSAAPFDTVVVLMMENRSYDHLLGWLPGGNGQQ